MTPDSTPFSLFFGLLLMTLPVLPLDASDSQPKGQMLLTDFTMSSSDIAWYVVNDNVMGGRSEGSFEQKPGELSFTGRTNTNGGGFSSIRTKPLQLDLSDRDGIRLYVMGDGRRYTWRLSTAASWRGRPVSYWADFEARKGTWSTVNIPFANFIPKFRGYQLDGPALDLEQITGMGLMIYDNQDGPFELHMASVHAYSASEAFTLQQYQWKNRVLVVSAPTIDDQHLVDQQSELTLTPEEFSSRDMVLVTLLGNAGSTAGTRELTNEEAVMARVALGIGPDSFALRLIGKDGSVKLSGETATSMTEIYALIDTMPMRQRETPVL
jgi:NADH dehydrogenase [ubiquinone] 1 alpha subcomplex assembly factor 1